MFHRVVQLSLVVGESQGSRGKRESRPAPPAVGPLPHPRTTPSASAGRTPQAMSTQLRLAPGRHSNVAGRGHQSGPSRRDCCRRGGGGERPRGRQPRDEPVRRRRRRGVRRGLRLPRAAAPRRVSRAPDTRSRGSRGPPAADDAQAARHAGELSPRRPTSSRGRLPSHDGSSSTDIAAASGKQRTEKRNRSTSSAASAVGGADELLEAKRASPRADPTARLDFRRVNGVVFELMKRDGLTLREVAQVLGTTTNAVKLRAHRAHAALRIAK